ncbi:hypothetical protein [Paenibacillus sp. NEAU-GSW1]|uniref:hypothetical protein n=1 Tax=Paenibacillus sp. NEAU-GSW1 TaxID=2682486 RepID=UPI0012E1C979|nr:hypothetical protein [Paenibacillus sp. NEAU-GSW1]MUT67056.1 hypothetical protein [Paenibacillus sp. NEAU-GSW1]
MSSFQIQVERLRAYEPICYTICLSLLADQRAAEFTAEKLLLKLFGDASFWQLDESKRERYVLRLASAICFEQFETQYYMKSS